MRDFGAVMMKKWRLVGAKIEGYCEGTNTPEDNMHVEGHWRMNLTYQL